eukprot:scaffold13787_cov59-Attheya_sp.AAC.6
MGFRASDRLMGLTGVLLFCAIVSLLLKTEDEVVLCPKAVFRISGPVVFTRNGQKLYTKGLPTGTDRAMIQVVDPLLITAVVMVGFSDLELKSVVIDGNCRRFGYSHVHPSNLAQNGGALILARGSTSGMTIRNVKSFDNRGWSALHAREGTPESPCSGMLLQDNDIGPAGESKDDMWSDGISFACTNSIVRNNTITDATDVGIVVFCAPGTVFEDNVIRAKKSQLLGGIAMVDPFPYNKNYTGTVVRRNVIDAQGASIKIGFLSMGARLWFCLDSNLSAEEQEPYLYGAVVTSNILRGKYMQYGYAADGVQDWRATENLDEAHHSGIPTMACNGLFPASPKGFQFYKQRSKGVFQEEFEDSYVSSAVKAIAKAAPAIPELCTQQGSDGVCDADTRKVAEHQVEANYREAIARSDAALNVPKDIETSLVTCIPSGDHRTIQHALETQSSAVLCAKIYTQGFPVGEKRAKLYVSSRTLDTAIVLVDRSHVELRNVIVDGGRQIYGQYVSTLHMANYRGALIVAGGSSENQLIHQIKAFDPRGPVTLHVQEGPAHDRCSKTLVAYSEFGPAGKPRKGRRSNGISFACTNSLVHKCIIKDASGVGIGIFGAPGST